MNGKAINPLDGRYEDRTKALSPYVSEYALMQYRTMVECEFLICLAESKLTDLRKLTPNEIKTLRALYENFSDASYKKIKDFEKTTNHDVKAVEYFIKGSLEKTSLKDTLEWVHFGLTSEDTNNSAYALMLSLSVKNVLLPELENIANTIEKMAREHKALPMLARTHGQSASPTTLGKEFAVFAFRLRRQMKQLKDHKVMMKLNGATGNYNAFVSAYPKANWPKFTGNFVAHLNKVAGVKLEANLMTTQIESHDTYAELFDIIRRANTILLDFDQDMWRYISDGYITQKPKAGEVGSSTMPHKVNPIDFENSEGNLGLANALFEHFARKLPISRLQRDLSDSTVERAFGTALGHSLLAYIMLQKGLGKISANKTKILEDLLAHPEVVAEAIQTVLRREKYPVPYEALKELTRGKQVTMADFAKFIDGLKVSPKIKAELKKFTPESYTGLASKLVK
jgi:adenylosuccinate lyase